MRIWKDISGYVGKYQVSDSGEIRNSETGKLRVLGNWGGHYLTINLYKGGTSKIFAVHRIVAETFVGSPSEPSFVVNHKNGRKQDNSVNNLHWCSTSENNLHALDNGLRKRPACFSKSAKSMQQRSRAALRHLYDCGVNIDLLAEAFKLSKDTAHAIARHG